MIEVIGYNRKNNDREKNDFYATPIQEIENILNYENLSGKILDPCCGTGNFEIAIKNKYPEKNIISTDLIDRGFGIGYLDFLSNDYPCICDISTIVMNPPFKLITEFVSKALGIANSKLILLARIQFLESRSRYENIFKDNPPNVIYQYIDRISCGKNGIFTKSANSMDYAWFVWNRINKKALSKSTNLKWIEKA